MEHLLNFFPINNLGQFSLRYRLYEIGPLPEGVTFHPNLQKMRKYVGREFGTPTALIIRNGKRYLAVAPMPKKKALPLVIEAPLLQNLVVSLRLQPDTHQIDFKDLKVGEADIVTNFLNFEVRSMLRQKDTLWKGNSPYIFYSKSSLPLPDRYHGSPVALYPGFSCYITQLPTGEMGFVVDIMHVYVDTRSLAQRMESGLDWRTFVGRHFLYEFGPNWYFIQLQSVDPRTIENAQFVDPRSNQTTNVYDYTLDKWRHNLTKSLRQLNKDDETLVYSYPNQSNQLYAACSLARLRYRTNDSEIGRLHDETILAPYQRLRRIQGVIEKYFVDKLSVNNTRLDVASDPIAIPAKVFTLPQQRFGNDRILKPPQLTAQKIKSYLKLRAKWLRDEEIGILSQDGGTTSQFLLMPLSLAEDEATAERIQQDITAKVNTYSPSTYRPQIVIWDDSQSANIPVLLASLEKHKAQMARAGAACALVILPQHVSRTRISKLRRHIKRLLQPEVRTKCILASEIVKRIPSDDCADAKRLGRYDSYLTFTALDLLVTSGHRLWSLESSLHYDLYIGIDVLNNTAGFTFVADGGAICRFVPSESEQSEALSAEQVAQVLLKHLRELIPRIKEAIGHLPRHIVVHRDGRWYDSERLGFSHAIKQLFREGLLTADVVTGVVEIQKTSAQRWRMFKREANRHYNPLVGTYHIFDQETGLVCTTGYPAIGNATAKPLVIRIADGNLEIEKVLQDVYWLSTLVWTKPDGIQSTPLTIKLADNWLEATAATMSDDEAKFGKIVAFSEEEELVVPKSRHDIS